MVEMYLGQWLEGLVSWVRYPMILAPIYMGFLGYSLFPCWFMEIQWLDESLLNCSVDFNLQFK